MDYAINAKIDSSKKAAFKSKENFVAFGIIEGQEYLPNPVELLLGSFAACCLKNIERFSAMLHFEYDNARIEVKGKRQESPTLLTQIEYTISIHSKDPKLNTELLQKNLQKYGTIYNTLKQICVIEGIILKV